MSEQTEPPCGTVKAPFPRHLYNEHHLFLKAIFRASIIIAYGYNDGTSIRADYYHWRDLVENGQWDWTENQPGYEDTDPSSMPPNDTLKFPCSRDIYELYIPFLKGLLEVRAINGFSYDDGDDDDEGGEHSCRLLPLVGTGDVGTLGSYSGSNVGDGAGVCHGV